MLLRKYSRAEGTYQIIVEITVTHPTARGVGLTAEWVNHLVFKVLTAETSCCPCFWRPSRTLRSQQLIGACRHTSGRLNDTRLVLWTYGIDGGYSGEKNKRLSTRHGHHCPRVRSRSAASRKALHSLHRLVESGCCKLSI